MITELNFHRVASVEVRKTREIRKDSGVPFYVRSIAITDDEGSQFTVKLFSDSAESLQTQETAELA